MEKGLRTVLNNNYEKITLNKTVKNYMYLDKYIEAAFKMWNVFKTDSVNCSRSGVPWNEALSVIVLFSSIGLYWFIVHVKSKITKYPWNMFSSLFLREPFCCEEKQESSGRLKYILRKIIERIFGKINRFPTLSNPQRLLKIHYLHIKCIVTMEYESESSYIFIHFVAKLTTRTPVLSKRINVWLLRFPIECSSWTSFLRSR